MSRQHSSPPQGIGLETPHLQAQPNAASGASTNSAIEYTSVDIRQPTSQGSRADLSHYNVQPQRSPECRIMMTAQADTSADVLEEGKGHGKLPQTSQLELEIREATSIVNNFFQGQAMQEMLNSCVDSIALCENCCLMFPTSGRKLNFRWGNIVRDQSFRGMKIDIGQFYKLFGRFTSRYKYHPLQMYENRVRKFDVNDHLLANMKVPGNGTSSFYRAVCGTEIQPSSPTFLPDCTTLNELGTIHTSSEYLFADISRFMPSENAQMGRTCYMRGFSRVIEAENRQDWERLRDELKNQIHVACDETLPAIDDSIPIAISYKGKSMKISRRFQVVDDEGGNMDGGNFVVREDKIMTSDILEDFRWDQIICAATEISRKLQKSKVRIWLDRLVMMGLEGNEIKRRYGLVNWTDFGLMPYAVCRVIRLYDRDEVYFCTDFWRKLETVMAVAGRGLFVDEYLLRKYDETIFYSAELYSNLDNGISCIGGKGKYLRSVTLAVATAIITDGVSVREGAEDIRTEKAVVKWKTWAARTVAEGAYSTHHSAMLRQEETPFKIGLSEFRKIAFWEASVSTCRELINGSYLDMSMQRSKNWRKAQKWDGVVEWIGMVANACEITERDRISAFLNQHCKVETWRSTEGHAAAMLMLTANRARASATFPSSDLNRTLVVRLSRSSSSTDGQLTAIAEATGLFGEKIIPPWSFFLPWPERDQVPILLSTSQMVERANRFEGPMQPGLVFRYSWMRVSPCCPRIVLKLLFVAFILIFAPLLVWGSVLLFRLLGTLGTIILVFIIPLIVITALVIIIWIFVGCVWPWEDPHDLGEAVFDNLLMHGLFKAGIKSRAYRRLAPASYREIKWY